MDWRNYQFWRKNLRRMDETTTEFDLLVQRTKQRIVLGERIRESFQLFQRSSNYSERVSKREIVSRKLRNIRQNLPFFK
jgi:hypothetical protein